MGMKKLFAIAAMCLCACTTVDNKLTYVEEEFFSDAFYMELPEREEELAFAEETTTLLGEEMQTPRMETGTVSRDITAFYVLKLYTEDSSWELVSNVSDAASLDEDAIWETGIQNAAARISSYKDAEIQTLQVDEQPAVLCTAEDESGARQYCLMIRSKDRKGCVFLQIGNNQKSYNDILEQIIQHAIDTFHWNQ